MLEKDHIIYSVNIWNSRPGLVAPRIYCRVNDKLSSFGWESSGAVIVLRSMINALLEVINRMSGNQIELRICSIGWSSPAEDSC